LSFMKQNEYLRLKQNYTNFKIATTIS